jgi:hypothetical protein
MKFEDGKGPSVWDDQSGAVTWAILRRSVSKRRPSDLQTEQFAM